MLVSHTEVSIWRLCALVWILTKINKPKSLTNFRKVHNKLLLKSSWMSTNQHYPFVFPVQCPLQVSEQPWHVDISEHLAKEKSTASFSESSIFLTSWKHIYSWSAEGHPDFKACDQSHENQWCLKLIVVSSSLLNWVLSQGFVSSNI